MVKKIEKRLGEEMKEKTKLRLVRDDKFERKNYIIEERGNKIIKIMKIRLNMAECRCNYKGMYGNEIMCPLCQEEEDTTEHLLQCKSNSKRVPCTKLKGNHNEWDEIINTVNENIDRRRKLIQTNFDGRC